MRIILTILICFFLSEAAISQKTEKPPLHGRHWMAITGKPLAATAGSMIFQQGGNAVDAACGMLAATCTMWDVLSWGGETQALIYNPNTGKVIGINALGVAPTGATPEYYKEKGMDFPPEFGPLAAVTPGTPGGLFTMLAEYGTMSLADVLAPAIEMAEGYPIEAQTANSIERSKDRIREWKYSRDVFLVHQGEEREAPHAGEIFRQADLHATLLKLVEAEKKALEGGKSRKEAIYAAYDRFYRGDIAEEIVRGTREGGGLFTMEDLDKWQVYIEEPVSTNYKGIDVYKLTSWVQGPVLLQALNMLENIDVKEMGYNSTRYLHTLYQVMNLAFADRDFYYGDPYFPPEEPMEGLLSKDYARERVKLINPDKNEEEVMPGDPYKYQEGENPFRNYLEKWYDKSAALFEPAQIPDAEHEASFTAGTTTIQAADAEGWVVSVTPSGGWVPAYIAGKTGVGLSQRMQSFVLDASENPYNVLEPGKRPRATLTPSLALKDGKPFLSFAVQGGDIQDQVLLQFFLNVVEFGMTVQEATEAANIISFQMRNSFGDHSPKPGSVQMRNDMPPWVLDELREMGYRIDLRKHTSGPINAIYFDTENKTFWGGSSNYGEDYGIGW
ncbi:gamma-glutamyltransferase family protein [Fulvivirga sedimenti]|uniref:Gamma-glutamyltransferase n=1 Tax=Fulvivirga sedimenti TaxID=2879465 RepID=A0A9X1HWC2_9BACT|nr:gamma-glutamyltransferase [Fulvivirga sedimenti]MCA6077982.1 gamma-glutamyltransferase [Fulvivirga sedimenti]